MALRTDQTKIRSTTSRNNLGLLLSALSFLGAWVLLLLIATRMVPRESWGEVGFINLGGLAGAASFALACAGAVFAYREYRQSERTNEFHLHRDLIRNLMSTEQIQARRWIIENVSVLGSQESESEWIKRTESKLSEGGGAGKEHVKRVLNQLDELGITLLRYWMPDHEILEWLAPQVLKPWIRIGPYVQHEARRRNAEGHYYYWARTFADETCQWLQANRRSMYHSLVNEGVIEGAL